MWKLNDYWKNLLAKAGVGALYAAIAYLAAFQNLSLATLYAALGGALLRGLVVGLTSIQAALSGRTTAKKADNVRKHWSRHF